MSELEDDNREYDVDEDYDSDFEESDEYQDALDYCDECGGVYGDNYYIDEDGEMVCCCPECLMNPDRLDGDCDD